MANRNEETGEFPEYPEEGSKAILEIKEVEAEAIEEEIPLLSEFVIDLEGMLRGYMEKWYEKDESDNFYERYDVEMTKDELRPLVKEEIRKEIDEENIILFKNLQVRS